MKGKFQTTWCFDGTLSTRQAVARDEAGEVGGSQTLGTLARICLYIIISLFLRCMCFFFFYFNFLKSECIQLLLEETRQLPGKGGSCDEMDTACSLV